MTTVSGRLVVTTIVAVVAIVVSIAAIMLFGHPRGKIAPPPSIAVLPLSGDADGSVAREIIAALKTIPNLEVKDGAGADRIDLKKLGENLNVRNLLDGSLDQSRVTIKVINAADEFELWSHTYNRDSLNKEIAHDVAAHISLH